MFIRKHKSIFNQAASTPVQFLYNNKLKRTAEFILLLKKYSVNVTVPNDRLYLNSYGDDVKLFQIDKSFWGSKQTVWNINAPNNEDSVCLILKECRNKLFMRWDHDYAKYHRIANLEDFASWISAYV